MWWLFVLIGALLTLIMYGVKDSITYPSKLVYILYTLGWILLISTPIFTFISDLVVTDPVNAKFDQFVYDKEEVVQHDLQPLEADYYVALPNTKDRTYDVSYVGEHIIKTHSYGSWRTKLIKNDPGKACVKETKRYKYMLPFWDWWLGLPNLSQEKCEIFIPNDKVIMLE